MKAEIKDENNFILLGLRSVGFNMKPPHIELILNVIDHVKEKKGAVTLSDLSELKILVESLFEE